MEKVTPEQVLTFFKREITAYGMTRCMFHHPDTDPSMQVNQEYVYCHGCGKSADTIGLARKLFELEGEPKSFVETLDWLNNTDFEDATLKYEKATYKGPPPKELILDWHRKLTPEHYVKLKKERLLEPETIDYFKLGFYPMFGISIPFWRGKPSESEVDSVQFRITVDRYKSKYIGLKNFSRGAIMNAWMLEHSMPYLVFLFGSFDPILGWQDGLNISGSSGAAPFKSSDHERIKYMFRKQHNIIVVPDNSPGEWQPAYNFAKLVGGRVAFFPRDVDGMDYIRFRKENSPHDFLRMVGVMPQKQVSSMLLDNVVDMINHSTTKFMRRHIEFFQHDPTDVAKAIAMLPAPSPFNASKWGKVQRKLHEATSVPDIVETIDNGLSNIGGW